MIPRSHDEQFSHYHEKHLTSSRPTSGSVRQKEDEHYSSSKYCISLCGWLLFVARPSVNLGGVISEELFGRDMQRLRQLTNSADDRLLPISLNIDDCLIRDTRNCCQVLLGHSLFSSPVLQP